MEGMDVLWKAKEMNLFNCQPMWGEGITLVFFNCFLLTEKWKPVLRYHSKEVVQLEMTVGDKQKINCALREGIPRL